MKNNLVIFWKWSEGVMVPNAIVPIVCNNLYNLNYEVEEYAKKHNLDNDGCLIVRGSENIVTIFKG